MKTLILYYSQAVGNTERVTNLLQKELNADMEKIDTLVPYRGTYEEISEQGHKEVNEGFKPRIKPIKHMPTATPILPKSINIGPIIVGVIVTPLLHEINIHGQLSSRDMLLDFAAYSVAKRVKAARHVRVHVEESLIDRLHLDRDLICIRLGLARAKSRHAA